MKPPAIFMRSRAARTVLVLVTFPLVWIGDRRGRVDPPARLRDGLAWAASYGRLPVHHSAYQSQEDQSPLSSKPEENVLRATAAIERLATQFTAALTPAVTQIAGDTELLIGQLRAAYADINRGLEHHMSMMEGPEMTETARTCDPQDAQHLMFAKASATSGPWTRVADEQTHPTRWAEYRRLILRNSDGEYWAMPYGGVWPWLDGDPIALERVYPHEVVRVEYRATPPSGGVSDA